MLLGSELGPGRTVRWGRVVTVSSRHFRTSRQIGRYARDATLNELRRLLPHPSDSTPAAAVLFLNRVANLIRDEDDNPPLDPFE